MRYPAKISSGIGRAKQKQNSIFFMVRYSNWTFDCSDNCPCCCMSAHQVGWLCIFSRAGNFQDKAHLAHKYNSVGVDSAWKSQGNCEWMVCAFLIVSCCWASNILDAAYRFSCKALAFRGVWSSWPDNLIDFLLDYAAMLFLILC